MGYLAYPPASGGKTAYRLSLTGGSSWTVPAGVTYINVTCVGGGGGAGGAKNNTGTPTAPSAGGATSFTGASSASGGTAGTNMWSNLGSTSYARAGTSQVSNTGFGGMPGFCAVTQSAGTWYTEGSPGGNGQIVTSTLATTPGAAISYSIGAGGSGGSGDGVGGAGGSGRIDIEYWV